MQRPRWTGKPQMGLLVPWSSASDRLFQVPGGALSAKYTLSVQQAEKAENHIYLRCRETLGALYKTLLLYLWIPAEIYMGLCGIYSFGDSCPYSFISLHEADTQQGGKFPRRSLYTSGHLMLSLMHYTPSPTLFSEKGIPPTPFSFLTQAHGCNIYKVVLQETFNLQK